MVNVRTILLIALLVVAVLLAACAAPSPAASPLQTVEIAPTSTPLPTKVDVMSKESIDDAVRAGAGEDEAEISAEALAVRTVAADALGVEPDAVTVLEMEAVEWRDASLGCPQPGMMYAQVITSGYRATVEVEGEQYQVHMDAKGHGTVCPPIE